MSKTKSKSFEPFRSLLARKRRLAPVKTGGENAVFKGLLLVLLAILPIILFFSYYPLISLGSDSTMNFELSLPLIFLLLFDIAALTYMLINFRFSRKYEGLSDRKIFILSWFPFFATISVFWSANPLRATLTAGILWALFFAFFALTHLFKKIKKTTKIKILKIFFIGSLVICAWCWLQCILDVIGVSRDTTLLCAGCTYQSFGFPHPNGFAIEPQFMGNLLLAPTLLAIYLFLKTKKYQKTYLLLVAIFSATLFLTFSRGAIYSFVIALILLLTIWIIRHKKFKKSLLVLCSTSVAFFFTLAMQGIFASTSPTSDTFLTGVTKSIHQLSLGIIDIRNFDESQNVVENTINLTQNESNITAINSDFSGYVPESTNTRLELSDLALSTWSQDAKTVLIGVGLGGAGVAIHRNFPNQVDSKEIIQNQYISILLELGIIGIIFLIVSLITIFRMFWHHEAHIFLFSLLLAYAISLCFFAGLPNALHIYLLPPLLYLVLKPNSKTKSN